VLSVENLLAYGPLGLFLVAFLESTVFPIPPDVLLLPLSMMSPRLSWWYAFLTSSASVLGGLAGYAVGRKAGRPVLRRFFKEESIRDVETLFVKYGAWAVGIAAFTPVPYKVFTFGAGIFRVPLLTFTVASTVGRSARFFFEGALVYFMGERAQAYLGTNFEIATTVLTVALLAITWLLPKMLPSARKAAAPRGSKPAVPPVYAGWLRSVRSQGAGFMAWSGATAVLGIFALAFLEDVAGPEREMLNAALGPAFAALPLVRTLRPVWTLVGNPWLLSAFALAGVAAHLARVYLRPGRPGDNVHAIAWRSLAARLVPVAVALYAVERGVIAYLGPAYHSGLNIPEGRPVLAPYLLLLGAWLFLEWTPPGTRVAGLAAAGVLAAGLASRTVSAGGLDAAVGMSSLIASAFAFCLTMAVLSTLRP
jgi:undecaprenyl-diphosphatase